MKELYERAQNYLSEIKEDAPDFFNEVNQFLDDIQNDKIPETFPEHPDCFFDFSETNLKKDTIMMLVRSYCQSIGYYGVVTKDYCKELKDYIGDKKVLEIMSGRGFLAKGLSEEGVYVKATDDLSWSNMKNSVFNIENQSAIDAVKQNKDNFDILLISWPPFNEYAINDVIKEWGSKKEILYIGGTKVVVLTKNFLIC